MIYIKVNNELYPAEISGYMQDPYWDNRPSKSIKVRMDYFTASHLFTNDAQWSIVQVNDENNEEVDEWDNSNYNIAGEIIDHRDGFLTIKMG